MGNSSIATSECFIDRLTINLGHCVHVIFTITVQNISNDGDKGVQILHQSTDVHWELKFGMHQCWMHVSDTDGRTDRQNSPVPLICLLTGVLDGSKMKVS